MGIPETHHSQYENEPESEFCSACSGFVSELNPITGWCESCSVAGGWIAPSCPICNRSTTDGKLCSRCKYVAWLERNANNIERVMATQSVSIRVARQIVRLDNRPICQSCGNPIKGGQKDRHFFCKKHPECIKAHTSYSYHIRHKPQREALELAITASVIHKLTANIANRERSS